MYVHDKVFIKHLEITICKAILVGLDTCNMRYFNSMLKSLMQYKFVLSIFFREDHSSCRKCVSMPMNRRIYHKPMWQVLFFFHPFKFSSDLVSNIFCLLDSCFSSHFTG